MNWHRERAEREPGFSYGVENVLSREAHAAAVIALQQGSNQWLQLVLYEIQDGRIRSVWAVEKALARTAT